MKSKIKSVVLATWAIFILLMGAGIFLTYSSCCAQVVDTTKTKEPLPAKRRRVEDKAKKEESKVSKKSSEEIYKELIEKQIRSYRPKVPSLIEILLNNPAPDQRLLAVEALAKARDPRAIEPLIEVLKSDTIAAVRQDAALALATISDYVKDYSTIPSLKEALNDNSIRVKIAAARALMTLGDTISSIPTLISIFTKEPGLFNEPIDVWIKQEVCRPDLPESEQFSIAQRAKSEAPENALKLLIKMGNDEVVIALTNCLNSNDEWVRKKARQAIEKIKTKQTGSKFK